jgi:hypothetical protein
MLNVKPKYFGNVAVLSLQGQIVNGETEPQSMPAA